MVNTNIHEELRTYIHTMGVLHIMGQLWLTEYVHYRIMSRNLEFQLRWVVGMGRAKDSYAEVLLGSHVLDKGPLLVPE